MGNLKKQTANMTGVPGQEASQTEAVVWPRKLTRSDTAAYINDMAFELKVLAQSAGFNFLTYLLSLVVEESAIQKRRRL